MAYTLRRDCTGAREVEIEKNGVGECKRETGDGPRAALGEPEGCQAEGENGKQDGTETEFDHETQTGESSRPPGILLASPKDSNEAGETSQRYAYLSDRSKGLLRFQYVSLRGPCLTAAHRIGVRRLAATCLRANERSEKSDVTTVRNSHV